jgi:hypothetical protein
MRRIGLLMGTADDREGQARVTAFKQRLQELGWTDRRNIQIETRPLYDQKRTLPGDSLMSAFGHKRTFCAAKGTPLFDHLIGPHGIFTDHGGKLPADYPI